MNHLTFCAKKFKINNWCAENINFLLRGPAKGTHPLIHSTTKISKQNAHLCATKSQELGHINWFISPVDEKFSHGEKKKKKGAMTWRYNWEFTTKRKWKSWVAANWYYWRLESKGNPGKVRSFEMKRWFTERRKKRLWIEQKPKPHYFSPFCDN